jgi:hypothetical protein
MNTQHTTGFKGSHKIDTFQIKSLPRERCALSSASFGRKGKTRILLAKAKLSETAQQMNHAAFSLREQRRFLLRDRETLNRQLRIVLIVSETNLSGKNRPRQTMRGAA